VQVTFWSGDPRAPRRGDENHQWWTLVALTLPLFAVTLDILGVAVLLPRYTDDLHGTISDAGWVLCAYVLAYAIPLVACARVVESRGGRSSALAGTAAVLLAAIGAAAAQEMWQLVASRVLAGLGAALFSSAAIAILRRSFTGNGWRMVVTVWAGVGAMGMAFGGVLAGLVVEQVGPRLFFLIPLPMLVVALYLVAVLVAGDDATGEPVDLDRDGLIALGLGASAIVGALLGVPTRGLVDPLVLGAGAVGLASLTAFARLERTGHRPLLDLRLLDDHRIARAALVTCCGDAVLGAVVPPTAIALVSVRDQDAFTVGMTIAAFGVPFAVAFVISEALVLQSGSRSTLVAGTLLVLVATGLLGFAGGDGHLGLVVAGLATAGLGHGMVLHLGTTEAVAANPTRAGEVAGLVGTLRWLSLVVGVAGGLSLLGFVHHDELVGELRRSGAELSGQEVEQLRHTFPGAPGDVAGIKAVVPELTGAVNQAVRDAIAAGVRAGLAVAVVAALAGLVAAVRLGTGTPADRPGPALGAIDGLGAASPPELTGSAATRAPPPST
jgi:hypothetical protein